MNFKNLLYISFQVHKKTGSVVRPQRRNKRLALLENLLENSISVRSRAAKEADGNLQKRSIFCRGMRTLNRIRCV